MAIAIQGNGGVVAEVTSASATEEQPRALRVALPLVAEQSGHVVIVSEQDGGDVTGSRRMKELEGSEDYRLRVGLDTPFLDEQFPGAALNSAIWTAPVTTMTVTVAGGFVNLNAGLSTANAAVARVSSYRSFPAVGTSELYCEIIAQFAEPPIANNVTEWGFGIATGTSAPTDGAFFRLNAAGEFRCVVNFNGTELQSGTLDFATLVGEDTTRHFLVAIGDDRAKFWIDDVLVAIVDRGVAAGAVIASRSLPVLLRTYNTAVTASAQSLKVGFVSVQCGDLANGRPWSHVAAGAGWGAYQGQTGATMGSTANYANSANPTAAVPTNTTAALGSGLGGQFWETDTLAVTTDGIISSYQVPAGTAALPGKSLYITGVRIESFVQAALTGGGYVAQWSLAVGHTAVSLATTETATSKAPRRIPLGCQTVASGAAALTLLGVIQHTFDSPIAVNAGEFVQTVRKKIGTAPSAGTIAHLITFNGYYE